MTAPTPTERHLRDLANTVYARLLADIRRTHPVTALMLSAEYIRCARADREAWLARYLPKLEGEWRV
jgi:hypothetical protein